MSQQDHPASAWRKSTYSDVNGEGNCVEVALAVHAVSIRDSKSPADGSLTVGSSTWEHFLSTL
jgi:uncharacterized protein DUF397